MRWGRRRHGAEIGTAEQHPILGMCGGIGLQTLDQQFRLVRRDAGGGRRQIEAMQGKCAIQQVHVRIDEARNHCLALEIDHPGVRAATLLDGCIVADGLDARRRHRPCACEQTGP